jgi:hypothetical protein
LGPGEIQGPGDAFKGIEGYHSLAALDLTDVGEAEVGTESEFLLGEATGFTLGPNGRPELALEFCSAIWHGEILIGTTSIVCKR